MYITATVKGYSMSPTLKDGDALLTDTRYKPCRGDIAVLKIPKKYRKTPDDKYVVKRIVAVGGDSVFSRGGVLYVNSKPAHYPSAGKTDGINQCTVPKNHVYVLGDNREHSLDSRVLGCIPYRNIRGKILKKLDKSCLKVNSNGYTPKSLKQSFRTVKSEIYSKWGLK